jgi:catalase
MEIDKNKLPAEFTFNESYKGSNDDYAKLGEQYRLLSDEAKSNLVENVIATMKDINRPQNEYMLNIRLCHWFRTDINLGITIAKGLDLDLSETMKQMPMM